MTVFLARGLKPGEAEPEEDERIDFELVPLSQADQDDYVGRDSRRQDHRRRALVPGATGMLTLWGRRLSGSARMFKSWFTYMILTAG